MNSGEPPASPAPELRVQAAPGGPAAVVEPAAVEPSAPAKVDTRRRRAERLQKMMLRLIIEGARQTDALERQLASHPPPELETLLKLHRVLILQLTLNAADHSDRLKVAQELMRPLLQWAQLEEKRRAREERARAADQARKLTLEEERRQALENETLNLCEQQLRLF